MTTFLFVRYNFFICKWNRNALKNEYMCVFYVTHDINMKPAGRLQLLFNTHLLPRRVICRSAKMAMYSPHISVFLRRDQSYDLGSVNNLFGGKTNSNGSLCRLYLICLIIKLTNNSMFNFIWLPNSIKINFVRFC